MGRRIVKLFKLIIMAIQINSINDHQLLVNNKLVVQDSDNNWIAKIELTTQEQKA